MKEAGQLLRAVCLALSRARTRVNRRRAGRSRSRPQGARGFRTAANTAELRCMLGSAPAWGSRLPSTQIVGKIECGEKERAQAAGRSEVSLSPVTLPAPLTLPHLTKWNLTGQLAKFRRKRTALPLAHPPFFSTPRQHYSFVTSSCGKAVPLRQEKAAACNRNGAPPHKHVTHPLSVEHRGDVQTGWPPHLHPLLKHRRPAAFDRAMPHQPGDRAS